MRIATSNKKGDKLISFAIIAILFFSIFMIPSASLGIATGNLPYIIQVSIKQIIYVFIGYILLSIVKNSNIAFNLVNKYYKLALIILPIFLLIPRLFSPVGGTYGWITLPFGMTIQPAEFAKVYLIVIFAVCFKRNEDRITNHNAAKNMLKHLSMHAGLAIFIILIIQKDFGSAITTLVITSGMIFSIRNPFFRKYQITAFKVLIFLIIISSFVLSPLGTAFFKSLGSGNYQIKRFIVAADPFSDQYASGFQLIKGLISIASGGFFGVGYTKGIFKYTHFPAADTDFIIAVIIEEFGLIGYIFIAAVYLILIARLFKYLFKIESDYARLVLVGTTLYFFIHFALNVGGASAFLPLTGVPLLLVSAGGSSTMAALIAIGLSQNIIRRYQRGIIK